MIFGGEGTGICHLPSIDFVAKATDRQALSVQYHQVSAKGEVPQVVEVAPLLRSLINVPVRYQLPVCTENGLPGPSKPKGGNGDPGAKVGVCRSFSTTGEGKILTTDHHESAGLSQPAPEEDGAL